MKAIPSIAFSEFRGTASEVTARQVGGRTILNGRAQHSHIKTPKQALRRGNFSYITKQYKTLTAAQLAQWSALAAAHKEKALTGNGTPLTAHNLFMCLNANRSFLGVPMTKDAPENVHGSSYISYDDIWITPSQMIITGLSEPESATSRLVVKLAVSERKGTTKSKWNSTVILGSYNGSDWGDVDMLSAYISEFNVPIIVGHTYYLEMYWIDENSGYVSQVTRVAVTATDGESLHGQEYVSRARVTMVDIDENWGLTDIDLEISEGSAIVSVDAEYSNNTGVASGVFTLKRVPDNFLFNDSFLLGRCSEESGSKEGGSELKPCTFELWLRNAFDEEYSGTFAHRGGSYESQKAEVFGTAPMYK